jgi:hypothetical protein
MKQVFFILVSLILIAVDIVWTVRMVHAGECSMFYHFYTVFLPFIVILALSLVNGLIDEFGNNNSTVGCWLIGCCVLLAIIIGSVCMSFSSCPRHVYNDDSYMLLR